MSFIRPTAVGKNWIWSSDSNFVFNDTQFNKLCLTIIILIFFLHNVYYGTKQFILITSTFFSTSNNYNTIQGILILSKIITSSISLLHNQTTIQVLYGFNIYTMCWKIMVREFNSRYQYSIHNYRNKVPIYDRKCFITEIQDVRLTIKADFLL